MNVPPSWPTMHPRQRRLYLLNTHQAKTWREAGRMAIIRKPTPATVVHKQTYWWEKL